MIVYMIDMVCHYHSPLQTCSDFYRTICGQKEELLQFVHKNLHVQYQILKNISPELGWPPYS